MSLALEDIAGDVIEKYENKYNQIKEDLQQTIQNNEQYKDDIRQEKNQEARERAFEKAKRLKENYLKSLKNKVEKKEKEIKRDQKRQLAKRENRDPEEKLQETMDLLLTQQIINGQNEQQIKDHLLKNLDQGNEEAVKLMSYYFAGREGSQEIKQEMQEFLRDPLEDIGQIKGTIRHRKANSNTIKFGVGSRNIRQDIMGQSDQGHYFNS
ncbi:MAG: hypothetical protein ACOCQA_00360 [bacterium]